MQGAPQPGEARTAGLLFVVVLTVYLACPVHNGFDSGWTVPVTVSILREGNIDLDEYRPTFSRHPHGVVEVGARAFNYFPLGPSLVALPFVGAAELGIRALEALGGGELQVVRRWRNHFDQVGDIDLLFWDTAELIAASVAVALAVVLVYLAARQRFSRTRALATAVIFGLGTSALSTASRALWQHGPDMLCLAATLYCLERGRGEPRWVRWAGVPLALAYTMRPTSALSAVGLTAYVALRHRGELAFFLIGATAVALPWLGGNRLAFDRWLPLYYEPQRLGSATFLEALAGNLVSPARGLLVYTPVVLLAAVGLGLAVKRRTVTGLEVAVAVISVAHWLSVSTFPHWWAGHSYGPRFMSDVLPYLAYLSLPAVAELGPTRRRLSALAAALALLGGAIHLHGATSQGPYRWNDGPPNVDSAPSRVWDWRDLQILRCMRSCENTSTSELASQENQPRIRSMPASSSASTTARPAEVRMSSSPLTLMERE